MNHQSIQAVETRTVIRMSLMELQANWRCAASLADKEGLHGTAERLRNDADKFEELGTFTIEVNS